MRRSRFMAFVAATLALAAPAHAAKWTTTWAASAAYGQAQSSVPTGGFGGDTIRTIVQSSVGGTQVKLRFSNFYGDRSMTIGRATIALAGSGSSLGGAAVEARFNGSASVTVAPGAIVLSDPITFTVPSRRDLAVSMYSPNAAGPATTHPRGFQTSYVAAGDQTKSSSLSSPTSTTARYFLTSVDVLAGSGLGTIAAFGDSITDGLNSTVNSDGRWPDQLSAKLVAASLAYGVANEGISGNGVVTTSTADRGERGVSRFDRDVLSLPSVTHAIILIGINDIGKSSETTAQQVIDGLTTLANKSKQKGVKVYGATLLPVEGHDYYSAANETKRKAVNSWIRTTSAFNGFIDFDKTMADPAKPTRLRPSYDSGDHLHPNNEGFKAMANAINLNIFR